jgi:hypothetical protein
MLMSLRPLLAAFGLLLCAAAPVLAQAPASAPPNPFAGLIRFSGTVATATGHRFVIHSQQGGDLQLSFADKPNIMVSHKGTVADLAAGKFVGCTAVKRADSLLHATECHIFPESMRGMGEGHNPMGPPNTTMTNGNVATMNASGEVTSKTTGASASIKVTYQGGAQTIEVGADADITQIDAGTPAMVKPGVKVMGAAKPTADGSAEVVFLSITP